MASDSAPDIVIKLSSGYPRRQLDRLLLQLEPVFELTQPARVTLDLNGLVFLGPSAQAIVAAVFHRLVTEDLLLAGSSVVMPGAPNVLRYLTRMRFFEPFIGELPEDFKRHEPSGFRPLQHFDTAHASYFASFELKNAIGEACQLDEGSAPIQALHVCLAELAENVIFHSDAPYGGFAAAQGWQKRPEVEVAIVDMGIGIRASLAKNPVYGPISHDAEAIEKALEPMVTATPDRNTGLGLSFTRFLLRNNGGELMVRSDRGAVYAGATEKSELCDSRFPGTIVTLTARTDAPLDQRTAWDDLRRAGYQPDDDV